MVKWSSRPRKHTGLFDLKDLKSTVSWSCSISPREFSSGCSDMGKLSNHSVFLLISPKVGLLEGARPHPLESFHGPDSRSNIVMGWWLCPPKHSPQYWHLWHQAGWDKLELNHYLWLFPREKWLILCNLKGKTFGNHLAKSVFL